MNKDSILKTIPGSETTYLDLILHLNMMIEYCYNEMQDDDVFVNDYIEAKRLIGKIPDFK